MFKKSLPTLAVASWLIEGRVTIVLHVLSLYFYINALISQTTERRHAFSRVSTSAVLVPCFSASRFQSQKSQGNG